jgi:hypothetical protein
MTRRRKLTPAECAAILRDHQGGEGVEAIAVAQSAGRW